jgi:signal transduction histidine kinase/ActR/RegA family two-component response regulator
MLDNVYATGKRVVAEAQPATFRLPSGQEEERFLSFVYEAMRDADGVITGVLCEGSDVTEGFRAQEQMRRSEERFRAALEIETVGAIYIDQSGTIIDANDAFLRMSGFEREDITAKTLDWQKLTPSEWQGPAERAWAELKLRGQTTAELGQAHEALRQAQKMEAVGQLIGGIAHDFNNLLAGISGALEAIERRIAKGKTQDLERFIGGAQQSARRAAALTQRLLAFSRRQTLDPKPTDVNKLVFGMEDLIRRTIGPSVALEVVGAAGLWLAKLDPSQLENALLNLSINARDAMPDGGRITIETANKWLDQRAARERDLPPGQYLSICVTDTGTGMPKEIVDRIFDPFFTTKPIGQGTGLGLSMIYGFVRQSGGQVRVYSEVGQGTTMCMYFPRFTGELVEESTGEDGAVNETGDGETVLVIDDEATVRMLVVEVLEEAGYRALEAEDGPSGLKILQSDARIDLLITDVGLPGGLNGRQVADAARRSRPELKVLFITGFAENAAVGNGHLEAGMSVVTKPFALADLAARISEMIEGDGL